MGKSKSKAFAGAHSLHSLLYFTPTRPLSSRTTSKIWAVSREYLRHPIRQRKVALLIRYSRAVCSPASSWQLTLVAGSQALSSRFKRLRSCFTNIFEHLSKHISIVD